MHRIPDSTASTTSTASPAANFTASTEPKQSLTRCILSTPGASNDIFMGKMLDRTMEELPAIFFVDQFMLNPFSYATAQDLKSALPLLEGRLKLYVSLRNLIAHHRKLAALTKLLPFLFESKDEETAVKKFKTLSKQLGDNPKLVNEENLLESFFPSLVNTQLEPAERTHVNEVLSHAITEMVKSKAGTEAQLNLDGFHRVHLDEIRFPGLYDKLPPAVKKLIYGELSPQDKQALQAYAQHPEMLSLLKKTIAVRDLSKLPQSHIFAAIAEVHDKTKNVLGILDFSNAPGSPAQMPNFSFRELHLMLPLPHLLRDRLSRDAKDVGYFGTKQIIVAIKAVKKLNEEEAQLVKDALDTVIIAMNRQAYEAFIYGLPDKLIRGGQLTAIFESYLRNFKAPSDDVRITINPTFGKSGKASPVRSQSPAPGSSPAASPAATPREKVIVFVTRKIGTQSQPTVVPAAASAVAGTQSSVTTASPAAAPADLQASAGVVFPVAAVDVQASAGVALPVPPVDVSTSVGAASPGIPAGKDSRLAQLKSTVASPNFFQHMGGNEKKMTRSVPVVIPAASAAPTATEAKDMAASPQAPSSNANPTATEAKGMAASPQAPSSNANPVSDRRAAVRFLGSGKITSSGATDSNPGQSAASSPGVAVVNIPVPAAVSQEMGEPATTAVQTTPAAAKPAAAPKGTNESDTAVVPAKSPATPKR